MTARKKWVGTFADAVDHPRSASSVIAGSRAAQGDPRWPSITVALTELRARHRYAVRIVDTDCACGTLLIEVMRYARALGFTAIEGHGIDGAPTMIGRARAAAARLHDPAIGLTFELADMVQSLAREADFPADIILYHDRHGEWGQPDIASLLAAAGDLVIDDPVSAVTRRQAA